MIMMEEFVTYDIALKLKEKGFKEKCFAYYFPEGSELCFNRNPFRGCIVEDCLYSHNSLPMECVGSDFIDLPTVSQVLKWLRKEKKLYILIDLCQHNIYKELWWIYSVRDLKDDSTYILPEGCKKCRFYEGAALAGIRFVLDNLI